MTWRERANCFATFNEVFFLEVGQNARRAHEICAGCEVTTECLEYAMETRQYYGIWAGTNLKDRRKLRKQRAA